MLLPLLLATVVWRAAALVERRLGPVGGGMARRVPLSFPSACRRRRRAGDPASAMALGAGSRCRRRSSSRVIFVAC